MKKDKISKLLEASKKIRVICGCGQYNSVPAFIDESRCTRCGKKLKNNTAAHFKYKLRKEINDEKEIFQKQ